MSANVQVKDWCCIDYRQGELWQLDAWLLSPDQVLPPGTTLADVGGAVGVGEEESWKKWMPVEGFVPKGWVIYDKFFARQLRYRGISRINGRMNDRCNGTCVTNRAAAIPTSPESATESSTQPTYVSEYRVPLSYWQGC